MWLNRTHSFSHFKFTSKIFQVYALSFGKISSKSSKICSICPKILQIMLHSHYLFIQYTLFSDACPGRELSKIPANQAEFAQFTHRSHELRELHAFCTKIHPHLVHYFQTSDHRQRTLENWSESTRFCAVRPQLPRIMQNLLNPHPFAPMTSKLGVNPGNSRNVQ